MNVLIDTNVVLTYVMSREDKYKDAIEEVMGLCAEDKIQGYIAFHTLSTMWYVLGKDFKDIRREMMKGICGFLMVVGCNQQAVLKALDNEEFKDFEDNLQDECAVASMSEYIVTCNVRDFTQSKIKAVTPEEFLRNVSI